MSFGLLNHSPYPFLTANIPRIQSQGGNSLINSLQGQTIIKMNICHQWHLYLGYNIAKILRCLHIWHSQADNITASSLQSINLSYSSLCIGSFGIGHGLNRNRRSITNGHIANIYSSGLFPIYHFYLSLPIWSDH